MILCMDLLEVVDGDMGIDLGGFQGLVSQHLLQVPGRGSVFEHVRGAGVAERVRGDIFFNAGKIDTALDHRPDAVGIHLPSPAIQDQVARVTAVYIAGSNHQDIVLGKLTDPFA